MTMHTIRGSTGIIKALYTFHANIITSSDMGIFLAISNNAYEVARHLNEIKKDAVDKTRALYYPLLAAGGTGGVIQWGFLYDAWAHHLDFHSSIFATIQVQTEDQEIKKPECIWDI